MKCSYIVFPSQRQAVLLTGECNDNIVGNQVLVRNEFDLISAGTELANYRGLPNTIGHYPIYPGYSVSGRVEKIGPDVKNLKIGDKVVIAWRGHASMNIANENDLFKISDGVDMEIAACTHLASFPLLGIRKLQIQLGESVMIAGLGLLGLFAVQMAKLSGASPVLACDFSPERRSLALQLGADLVFDPGEDNFVEKVKAATEGRGVDGVVEVTGYISALKKALEYVAWEGRISLLGCTRISDDNIDYYKYVHRRGIHLIGCHTYTRPKVDSRPGEWTEFDDYRTYFNLVKNRGLQVKPIISRLVSPWDVAEIYEELDKSPNPPLGLLLNWRDFK